MNNLCTYGDISLEVSQNILHGFLEKLTFTVERYVHSPQTRGNAAGIRQLHFAGGIS